MFIKQRSMCPVSTCFGALMQNDGSKRESYRSKDETLSQAVRFIEEYHMHEKKFANFSIYWSRQNINKFSYLNSFSAEDLTIRLDEITRELNETGTYTPTTNELEFGARTAWRNASRVSAHTKDFVVFNQKKISNVLQCIGRMQWKNLHFFDARHAHTTKEMFDAVCKHIEFATNDGNIRWDVQN